MKQKKLTFDSRNVVFVPNSNFQSVIEKRKVYDEAPNKYVKLLNSTIKLHVKTRETSSVDEALCQNIE